MCRYLDSGQAELKRRVGGGHDGKQLRLRLVAPAGQQQRPHRQAGHCAAVAAAIGCIAFGGDVGCIAAAVGTLSRQRSQRLPWHNKHIMVPGNWVSGRSWRQNSGTAFSSGCSTRLLHPLLSKYDTNIAARTPILVQLASYKTVQTHLDAVEGGTRLLRLHMRMCQLLQHLHTRHTMAPRSHSSSRLSEETRDATTRR